MGCLVCAGIVCSMVGTTGMAGCGLPKWGRWWAGKEAAAARTTSPVTLNCQLISIPCSAACAGGRRSLGHPPGVQHLFGGGGGRRRRRVDGVSLPPRRLRRVRGRPGQVRGVLIWYGSSELFTCTICWLLLDRRAFRQLFEGCRPTCPPPCCRYNRRPDRRVVHCPLCRSLALVPPACLPQGTLATPSPAGAGAAAAAAAATGHSGQASIRAMGDGSWRLFWLV